MGDFHHTDHVHGFTPGSEYECYDRDVTDHVGKCSDGADTPAGTDCAAKFIAADSFEADGCPTAAPDNCTWTKAPVAPNPKPPHPAAASLRVERMAQRRWLALSGFRHQASLPLAPVAL